MKKLIALAVAILMIAAMAVPAFAAKLGSTPEVKDITLDDASVVSGNVYGDENEWENEGALGDAAASVNEGTRLVYGVAQSYIVSIPADVAFEEALDDSDAAKTKGYVYAKYTIGLYDVIVAGDEKMEITAASQNSWTLVDDEGTKSSTAVNYYLTIDNYMTSIQAAGATAANQYMVDLDGAETAKRLEPVLTVAAKTGNAGTAGNEGTQDIFFSSLGTAQEGTFKDIITFTVAVVPAA